MSTLIKILLLILIVIIAILFVRTIGQLIVRNVLKEFIGGSDNTIAQEYQKWSVTKARNDILRKNLDPKRAYEATNILERWSLSGINFGADKDHKITDKMKSELLEKHIVKNAEAADGLVNRLFAVKPIDPPSGAKPIIEDSGHIEYGEYSRDISPERMKMLRAIADDSSILRASLRYSSMISGSQQWNIPRAVYKLLVEKYNVTIEGFASPFNSQLLPFSTKESMLNFCSLFLDTDAVFGSVGSYFDYDFVGKIATVNPPYILDIMDAVAAKCIQTCADAETANKPTRMFITVPDWTDTYYYQKLSDTKYLETALHHKAGEYYYEDSNNLDKKVTARFNTTVFVLSYGYPKGDYTELNTAFSV